MSHLAARHGLTAALTMSLVQAAAAAQPPETDGRTGDRVRGLLATAAACTADVESRPLRRRVRREILEQQARTGDEAAVRGLLAVLPPSLETDDLWLDVLQAQIDAGRRDEAAALWRRLVARAADGPRSEPLRRLAVLAVRADDAEAALRLADDERWPAHLAYVHFLVAERLRGADDPAAVDHYLAAAEGLVRCDPEETVHDDRGGRGPRELLTVPRLLQSVAAGLLACDRTEAYRRILDHFPPAHSLRLDLLCRLARHLAEQDDPQGAADTLARARAAIDRPGGDDELRAGWRRRLALAHADAGDAAGAAAILQDLPEDHATLETLAGVAGSLAAQGLREPADRHFAAARRIVAGVGIHDLWKPDCLIKIALAHLAGGDAAAAGDALAEALRRVKDSDITWSRVDTVCRIAEVQTRLGDPAAAAAAYALALSQVHAVAEEKARAGDYFTVADSQVRAGLHAEANRTARRWLVPAVRRLEDAVGPSNRLSRRLHEAAMLHVAAGDPWAAYEVAARLTDRAEQADVLHAAAALHAAGGHSPPPDAVIDLETHPLLRARLCTGAARGLLDAAATSR